MCSCDRATYARATAIILYDFCRALDIPIMVYGHSTSSGRVDLYSYAEFDAIDRDDRYRLMDISSRGSNRDGAALRYVAEQLAKRTEDVKILMLVSDGQPADSGYYGTAAEEDLRGVKQEYQRKGILFVAAAIGADKDNIERIYGDSFLDITDLNKLPRSNWPVSSSGISADQMSAEERLGQGNAAMPLRSPALLPILEGSKPWM